MSVIPRIINARTRSDSRHGFLGYDRLAHELQQGLVIERFRQKTECPASNAACRTDKSSRPVIKMIRVAGEFFRSVACTSRPFMSGIQTSRIATPQDA